MYGRGWYGKMRKRRMCFNLVKEKKTKWAKRFPINVNEGLSQKDFFFSFEHETRGQVLMLTSRAGSTGLPLKYNRKKHTHGINHTAGRKLTLHDDVLEELSRPRTYTEKKIQDDCIIQKNKNKKRIINSSKLYAQVNLQCFSTFPDSCCCDGTAVAIVNILRA